MKWITREKPKIDRIACPLLIKRFVGHEAEIIYVSYAEVFLSLVEICNSRPNSYAFVIHEN